MAHRVLLGIASLAGMAALAGSAVGATRLTDRNSINPAFRHSGTVTSTGTGCGSTGSAVDTVPTGATGIKVLTPKVGDRATGGRVTEVRVAGSQITVTAVGDGPEACDPDPDGEPPATRPWSATYKVSADYRRRLQTVIRTNFTAQRPKFRLAPRTVYTDRVGRTYGKVVGIKWKRFGSKQATGSGVYKERPAGFDHNKRVKVIASRAGYCRDSGKFEYREFTVRTRSHLVRGAPAYCG
jgi:hypothetical protein